MYALEQRSDPFLSLNDADFGMPLAADDTTINLTKIVLAVPDLSTLAVGGGFLTDTLQLVLRPAGAAIAGIHGYRRHGRSIECGLLYGVAGFFFPIVMSAISFASGYGKPRR